MKDTLIENQNFAEERALYHASHVLLDHCSFSGEEDGESALKEASDVTVRNCEFRLRYPFWHTGRFLVEHSEFTDTCRAALWYAADGEVRDSTLAGIKALRECDRVKLERVTVRSAEFGWKCSGVSFTDCTVTSEYFLLDTKDVHLENVEMHGKYSFQYTENVEIRNSRFDTKDAFWHSRNVTVRDSEIRGEYLGWYSEGLHLINCRIIGTQPLCYCKGLILENCTVEDGDLAFEYSDVRADISGEILSVKNPCSGTITADRIGKIILEDAVYPNTCRITERLKK